MSTHTMLGTQGISRLMQLGSSAPLQVWICESEGGWAMGGGGREHKQMLSKEVHERHTSELSLMKTSDAWCLKPEIWRGT